MVAMKNLNYCARLQRIVPLYSEATVFLHDTF